MDIMYIESEFFYKYSRFLVRLQLVFDLWLLSVMDVLGLWRLSGRKAV
jgi:hypothetical protein